MLKIERIIDIATPQLVHQALYEQIRRSAACVVDWSDFKSSVFLELGVRLAVSEWGAISIIDERCLPAQTKQIELMQRLFSPIAYRRQNETVDAFERVADEIVQRNPNLDEDPKYNLIYRALLPVIASVEAAQPPVIVQLKRRADALHDTQQSRSAIPRSSLAATIELKKDGERSRTRDACRSLALSRAPHRDREVEDPNRRCSGLSELGGSASGELYELAMAIRSI